jgi:RNA polymerase sigma factor (sigma-70 family)
MNTHGLPDAPDRHTVLQTLIREHGDAIVRYCRTRLGEGLAEEVAQDVFFTAWQQSTRWQQPQGNLLQWVFGIAKKKCQQAYRNRVRRQAILQAAAAEIRHRVHAHGFPIPGDDQGPAAMCHRLEQGLAKLLPEERLLVSLRYWKGLPIAEIADMMGRSSKTIQRWLEKAERRLKEYMS